MWLVVIPVFNICFYFSFYPSTRAICFYEAEPSLMFLQTDEYDEYFSEVDGTFRMCSLWTFVCDVRGRRTSDGFHAPAGLCSVQRMYRLIPLDFGSTPVCCTSIRASFVHGLHFSLLRHWFLPSPALAWVRSCSQSALERMKMDEVCAFLRVRGAEFIMIQRGLCRERFLLSLF